MQMKFFLILMTYLSMSLIALADQHSSLTQSKILRKYSLEQLDSVGHLLVAAFDQSPNEKNQVFCNISSIEAQSTLLTLHALIDEKLEKKIRKLQKTRRRSFHDAGLGSAQFCRKDCHCGVYATFLEKLRDHLGKDLAPVDTQLLTQLQEQAQFTSKAELDTCIKRTQWFCNSVLIKYLRKTSQELLLPAEDNP